MLLGLLFPPCTVACFSMQEREGTIIVLVMASSQIYSSSFLQSRVRTKTAKGGRQGKADAKESQPKIGSIFTRPHLPRTAWVWAPGCLWARVSCPLPAYRPGVAGVGAASGPLRPAAPSTSAPRWLCPGSRGRRVSESPGKPPAALSRRNSPCQAAAPQNGIWA